MGTKLILVEHDMMKGVRVCVFDRNGQREIRASEFVL